MQSLQQIRRVRRFLSFREALIAVVIGVSFPVVVKYIFAAILIIFLLLGNQ